MSSARPGLGRRPDWEELLESANLYEQFSSPDADWGVLASQLLKVSGAVVVLILSYLEEAHAMKIEAMAASAPVQGWVRETLGFDLAGRTWPIRKEEDLAHHRLGRLVRLGGLDELAGNLIPGHICRHLQLALGIGEVYGIGLMHHEQLMGKATILMPVSGVLDPFKLEMHAQLLAANMHRRQVETARMRSEERWRSLVEHSQDGVFVGDSAGRFVEVNPSACRMLGYSREELLQLAIPDCIAPGHSEEIQRLRQLVETGTFFGEVTVARKDGAIFPAEINSTRLPDGNYLATVRDITERKLSEESSARQAALEERDRARIQFLQVAAHELRNPMTAVKGTCALFRELLPSDESGGTIARLADVLEGEVNHLSSLLDEVLEAVRVQQGRLPCRLERVDVAGVLHASLAPFIQGDEGCRLVVEVEERSPVVVDGDARRLESVVRNLVHNASKYSPDGSEIRVRLEVQGAHVLLTVTDHGIGIPGDEIAEIFEGFHRGRNLDGQDPGGLGLGLKICRDIVTQHQGRIWVESHPGHQTTFFVELPLAAPSPGQAEVAEPGSDTA